MACNSQESLRPWPAWDQASQAHCRPCPLALGPPFLRRAPCLGLCPCDPGRGSRKASPTPGHCRGNQPLCGGGHCAPRGGGRVPWEASLLLGTERHVARPSGVRTALSGASGLWVESSHKPARQRAATAAWSPHRDNLLPRWGVSRAALGVTSRYSSQDPRPRERWATGTEWALWPRPLDGATLRLWTTPGRGSRRPPGTNVTQAAVSRVRPATSPACSAAAWPGVWKRGLGDGRGGGRSRTGTCCHLPLALVFRRCS
ncbi:guanine nucleotide-binding protein G(I)/G(S)/G(O) subunit gamma-7 isoform X1 [Marmota monax]|uniref:guanine nucleotide-binding protein G(I)/G(S)/G(O) subunit gamma-7 isoform X1 n=1 Tax=Marmota monax TaxID=9995 RepID=UPI0026F22C83|nr:guanine nucleotide-binding protein G(I)/G(S)/G(O) subunit gamma-7 isoform X1 [Marmota monax]